MNWPRSLFSLNRPVSERRRRLHGHTRITLGAEQLEARLPLDAQFVISELIAKNEQGLRDDDGDRSDWIEIYNAGDHHGDLTGWFLTDDAAQLDKWQFPSVSVNPHQFLTVYASGKNRLTPNLPLHTNFKLAARGEYLALVRPDGNTIAFEYESFPTQYKDIAFGLPQREDASLLVGGDSPATYLIPTHPDTAETLDVAWTESDFDDSNWPSATGHLGFDQSNRLTEQIDTDIEAEMHAVNSSVYLRYAFEMNDVQSIYRLVLRLKYDDGYAVYLNGREVARNNAPYTLRHDSIATDARPDSLLDKYEELDLTDHIKLLRSGEPINVLAIHGLNGRRTDNDFLIAPELIASRPGEISIETGRFFDKSTPDAPNGIVSFEGVTDTVQFSVPRGFYDDPQHVVLSSDEPGSGIIYTTDGSTPSLANGNFVPSANAESYPTISMTIDETTILRAQTWKDDFLSRPVQTHTYLFLDDVMTQSPNGEPPPGWPTQRVNDQQFDYGMDPEVLENPQFGPHVRAALEDLPSLSLVTDNKHWFDETTGIFVNAREAKGNTSYWERPTSFELINPDGSEGFQIDAGIRIRGNASRTGDNVKHGFRLFFRGEYGDPKLRYPLFGNEGVDEFDNLDLRGGQTVSWARCNPSTKFRGFGWCDLTTMLRDVLARDTQRDMGHAYTRSRYYHLYLNGQYWGLVQSQERAEASYAESYFGGDKADYDVIKRSGNYVGFGHVVATDGNLDAWRRLWDASHVGFEDNRAYYRVQGLNPDGSRNDEYPVLLDVENLIDYMLIIFYGGDADSPVSSFTGNQRSNNWIGIRHRNRDEGFRFFIHDAELAYVDETENRLGPWPAGETFETSNPQWIHQQLMRNAGYRSQFADRAHQHLFNGGALSTAAQLERLQERVDQIDLAIIAESARWGDAKREQPYTKDDWVAAASHIRDVFIPQRHEILLDQLRRATSNLETSLPLLPLYPNVDAPVFSQHGGVAKVGDQVVLTANDDIYVTIDGSDPRMDAGEVQESALIASGDPAKWLVPTDDSLAANWTRETFDDSTWSSGATALGFQQNGNEFEPILSSDIESQMRGVNSSVYVRVPFRVEDPTSFHRLQLGMTYDDGFVAFLNGTEVAQSNAPPDLTWNSKSWGSRRSDEITLTAEFIDISDFVHLLVEGDNVLAIHGMNSSRSGSDYLLMPQLNAGVTVDQGISSAAVRYSEPIELSDNVVVNARSLRNGQWSALTRATFNVNASPLQVSEIMYHPSESTTAEQVAGFTDDDDFEFVEFVNTSETTTVDLKDIRILDAVEFTFPDVQLAPGEYAVVARNAAALRQRYATELNIVGEYGSQSGDWKLSNRGEAIRVVDALGVVIQDFRYDDSWYGETDGMGRSLVATSTTSANTSTKAGWEVSTLLGGSPGHEKAILGDSNRDGVFDSEDFVHVFSIGKYDDGVANNATFDEGDWNQDGDFDEHDLVAAFVAGHYVTVD